MDNGFSDFFYQSQDGLKLHARIYGERNARLPVICLPGLTRNYRDFHDLARFLASDSKTPRRIICFDYRGRGQSAYDPNWQNYNVGVEAADILAGLAELRIEHAAFIGTSRGGLIMHVLAAMRPGLIKAAVLNDIGPAIEVEGLTHIRSYLQNAGQPKTFAEAIELQKQVHGPDFPALTETDWQRFVRAIYRDEGGKPVADYDPALIRTVLAMDLSKPLRDLWPQFEALATVPMLAIRGANSQLLSAETLNEMKSCHPRMEAITVQGHGHAPFLETGELPARIATFVERADATRG